MEQGVFPTLSSESSARTVICAYNYCTPLHNMRMKDIRVEHLEGAIRDADVGSATKGRMKSLFNMMFINFFFVCYVRATRVLRTQLNTFQYNYINSINNILFT